MIRFIFFRTFMYFWISLLRLDRPFNHLVVNIDFILLREIVLLYFQGFARDLFVWCRIFWNYLLVFVEILCTWTTKTEIFDRRGASDQIITPIFTINDLNCIRIDRGINPFIFEQIKFIHTWKLRRFVHIACINNIVFILDHIWNNFIKTWAEIWIFDFLILH